MVAESVLKQTKTRLIHVSAIGADSNSEVPYARTKGKGEDAIREVFAQKPDSGLRAVILRPG